MQLSPDIRYVLDGAHQLAVAFDGCYFTAYHVGSEEIGVNISMEMVVGVYPEVSQEALVRIGKYRHSEPTYGVWALDTVCRNEKPPTPKNVVREIDDNSSPDMLSLQTRLIVLNEGKHGLSKTMDTLTEAIDCLSNNPKKASCWAKVMVPILQAAAAEGITVNTILREADRLVARQERREKSVTTKR